MLTVDDDPRRRGSRLFGQQLEAEGLRDVGDGRVRVLLSADGLLILRVHVGGQDVPGVEPLIVGRLQQERGDLVGREAEGLRLVQVAEVERVEVVRVEQPVGCVRCVG